MGVETWREKEKMLVSHNLFKIFLHQANNLGSLCCKEGLFNPSQIKLFTFTQNHFDWLNGIRSGFCLKVYDKQAINAEQDQTARKCRLILFYTLR